VRIFHPSFRDFLLDRCIDQYFAVKEPTQHRTLASYCLHTLNRSLKRNICDIRNPSLTNDEALTPRGPTHIQKLVTGATRYACQFWVIHLSKSKVPEPNLLVAIRIFATEHLFHWVELLSLIGQVKFAMKHLPEATMWLKVSKLFVAV
jgi:hypothetical protein